MQHLSLTAAALVAASLSLSACNSEPEVIQANPDPQEKELAKAPPVTLPPAIKATRTYRCKDNSLVYVTFMADDMTAMVRDKQEEPPVATLKAPAPGEAYAAEGFSLSGSGNTVTYKSPDAGSQSCRA